MASSIALLHAASRLEGLLSKTGKRSNISDSTVAQISALFYYQASVLAKLESNKSFQNKFVKTVFKQINKDFSEYVDAQARTKPKSYHHVYEWKKTGSPNSRLFKLNLINSENLSFKLDYELLPSKSFVPGIRGRRKHKFVNKAFIMESGIPVKIAPKASKRLVFEVDGDVVFMPIGASVTVQNPGGKLVKQQFRSAYSRYFNSNLVSESFKKSGFTRLFQDGIAKALKAPASIKTIKYAFSPNTINLEANAALENSFGGVL